LHIITAKRDGMFLKDRVLILLIVLIGGFSVQAQEVTVPIDSTGVVSPDAPALRRNGIDAPVSYQAKDSIVLTAENMAYLFGEGNVKYQQIELQSEYVEMSMDSSIVYATFGLDSLGLEFGYPLFKDGEESQYESKAMRYNFGTRKAFITDVITQQGEGYVTSGRTKKMEDDVLNMLGGRYTTCDEHDHPHFYIHMTRAKVRPRKDIVTGPVYLVLEDVPLPFIGLPFAFFPFTSSYSSGVIMPSYGDENARGFFLRDGGYYFALSDYMDLALTGQIYTKGSWGVEARSSYRKRYKYSGNFNVSYQITRLGDVINGMKMPDYSKQTDMRINWTHSQDPKSNPFRTISASVNFSTSSYDRNSSYGTLNSSSGSGYSDVTQNNKSSTVNVTQRFPNSPFSLSSTMSVNQRMQDSSIALTMPDISITMSRIFPFKRKQVVGAERWYEKISMQYTGYFRNSINTKEDLLLKSSLVKDWNNSMQHTIPVSATFSLFNVLNITPSINYAESWHSRKVMQEYDMQRNSMAPSDTIYGFSRVYNYSASVGLSTTIYGNFKPLPFLGNKVEMIRHRMEPSVSFSMAPSFGDPKYGFYEHYYYTDINGQQRSTIYSPYAGQQGVNPNQSRQGNVNFSVSNNVEMKVRSNNDSIGVKKISLIDNLGLSISYNMAADSFQWSDLSANVRLKITKSYTLNLSLQFDTYTYEYNEASNSLRRVNVPRWEAGKGFGRLRGTSLSYNYTFNNDTFRNLFGGGGGQTASSAGASGGQQNFPDADEQDAFSEDVSQSQQSSGPLRRNQTQATGDTDADGYYLNRIPWSLSFNYSMNLSYDMQNIDVKNKEYKYKIGHTLSFNGNIQPSKNWRFNFSSAYDFDQKKIPFMNCSIVRIMHCWQMSASVIPVGQYKSYSFSISVSSSLLKDLKWDQRSNYRDGLRWY